MPNRPVHRRGIFLRALATLALTAGLAGCEKELCYNHYRQVNLAFEWELEWERDNGAAHRTVWDDHGFAFGYADLIPEAGEGVTTVIYGLDTRHDEYQFAGSDGVRLTVDDGRHSLMLVSHTAGHIEYLDMENPILAHATSTRAYRSTYTASAGEVTLIEPDMLYGAYVTALEPIDFHERVELSVRMQPLVFTYVFRIDVDAGLHHVALARGALSGMASGVYLRCGATTADVATLFFDECELTADGLVATVRSFGLPNYIDRAYDGPWTDYVDPLSSASTRRAPAAADDAVRQELTIELLLTGGRILTFTFDVSEQISAQPTGGVVKAAGIVITDEDNTIVGGGAFDVDVDPWGDTIEEELPITPI
jgi:hypothetical protein